MNQNKLKSYFGFAIKSGKVIFGYDNLFKSKKAPLLVVISPDLAEKMAKKVILNKRSIKLEPMSAFERKMIHTHLQNIEHISTHSEGTEPDRRLIIDYVE